MDKRVLVVGLLGLALLDGCGSRPPEAPKTPPSKPGEPQYDDAVAYFDLCERDPKAPAVAEMTASLLKKYHRMASIDQKFAETFSAIGEQRRDANPNGHGDCARMYADARDDDLLVQSGRPDIARRQRARRERERREQEGGR